MDTDHDWQGKTYGDYKEGQKDVFEDVIMSGYYFTETVGLGPISLCLLSDLWGSFTDCLGLGFFGLRVCLKEIYKKG